ncbi:carbohydrate ABC transporter permease [Vibrio ishigakensis]|uniref:carbohydrate ABC transporter permease n=1 Tax=Vibrio ishigakensis TaxID=1481914 RepID=UPI0036F20411
MHVHESLPRKSSFNLLHFLVMGSAQIKRGDQIKGVFLLVIQLLFIFYIPQFIHSINGLITLGEVTQQRNGFEVIQGDNSIHLLVEGVVMASFLVMFITLYVFNVKDSLRDVPYCRISVKQQFKNIYEEYFPALALTPAAIATLFFIILPIIITAMVALTNYSAPNYIPPRNLVDWVGLENFFRLSSAKGWSSTFISITIWTLIWATTVTILTYAVGFMMSSAVENRQVKFKGMWRLILILPYAIPAFVSLLSFRLMLNGIGPVNDFLASIGIGSIAFLTDPLYAKLVCIFVGVWLGSPFYMLLITSAKTNIPANLYEASEVDGASRFQQFREITLPLVLQQTAPTLVMNFAMNFNNMGIVYLITDGGPINTDYVYAGHTDILISWIYKMTLEFKQYQMASVVSILIFLFLSVIAIWQFRRMKSFKEEVA